MAGSSIRTYFTDLSTEGQNLWPIQSTNKVNIRLAEIWKAAGYISQFSEAEEFLWDQATESYLQQLQ